MGERARAAATAALVFLLAALLPGEEPRVGTVTVEAEDVFGPEDTSRGFIYKAANAVHVTTKESSIRRWLLFSEGDAFDPRLLEESERNLRALGLFRKVAITADPPDADGAVNVHVRTQDAWTVHVGLSVGSGGGQTQGGVTLGETNLLGTGKQLFVGYAQDQQRTYRRLEFSDPYFLIPHGAASIAYASNSDGGVKALTLSRPFYAMAAPWAAALALSDLARDEFLYAPGGAETDVYHAVHRRAGASWGLAFAPRDSGATRLSLAFDWADDVFTGGDPAQRPEDRRFRTFSLQFETVSSSYRTWNFVNRDDREEDVLLGPRFALRAGVSPSILGVDRTTGLVAGQLEGGVALGGNSLLTGRASFESRFGSRLENAVFLGQLTFVQRFESTPRQTLVVNVSALRGWNLYKDVQIFADGASGLRGYRLYAFEGDRRVVLNVEQRVFSGKQLFGLISPGVAVFVDAGLIGGPTQPLRLSGAKVDAGAGLRFAMSWAPVVNVFRLDAAYAFQADPAGRRGWLISFAAGQAF